MLAIPVIRRNWQTNVTLDAIGMGLRKTHLVRDCKVVAPSETSDKCGAISFRIRSMVRMPGPAFRLQLL